MVFDGDQRTDTRVPRWLLTDTRIRREDGEEGEVVRTVAEEEPRRDRVEFFVGLDRGGYFRC